MEIRTLKRQEIEKVRLIDRSEVVKQIYYYKHGKLTLEDEFYDIKGWDPSELESSIERLYDLYDRGGALYGAFARDRLVGVSALESEFIGSRRDQLQLYFHHVDRHHRHKGVGKELLMKVVERGRELGAKKLYISATPSKNTIDFYKHMGCTLTTELNPRLFKLEPEDIHLELRICEM